MMKYRWMSIAFLVLTVEASFLEDGLDRKDFRTHRLHALRHEFPEGDRQGSDEGRSGSVEDVFEEADEAVVVAEGGVKGNVSVGEVRASSVPINISRHFSVEDGSLLLEEEMMLSSSPRTYRISGIKALQQAIEENRTLFELPKHKPSKKGKAKSRTQSETGTASTREGLGLPQSHIHGNNPLETMFEMDI